MASRDGDGWVECRCGSKHWGVHGAAGLLLVHAGKVLLQHRAPWVHNGDTWGIPGGARDSHESSLEAALREANEEIGIKVELVQAHSEHRDDHGDWRYDTIIATASAEAFLFEKNHETID
ncbi:MAG: NUDIX domain-containing protein, partial [Actinobacteria bacterium]|nr:NUDIX domain-containing protein [Actinomycetota bacterium]